MEAKDLIGTWRLRSWTNTAGDAPAVDPLGPTPIGYILYNADGYMAVEIMAAGRAPYREPDPFGGTPQERSAAIGAYLSYSGRFEVLPEEGAVIHHIEVSSYPNWVGTAQLRLVGLDGDQLTLSTRPMALGGVEQRAELAWERVKRA